MENKKIFIMVFIIVGLFFIAIIAVMVNQKINVALIAREKQTILWNWMKMGI